jgi:hypothetical protein
VPVFTLTLADVLAEVRRRCGDSPSYHWAYNRVLTGALPAAKVGQAWRLPPEAVDVLAELWLASRRVAPVAAA